MPDSLRSARATPSHWLFRRELLARIGGADPGVFIQDYSLELELGLATRVAQVDAPLLATPHAAPGRMSANHAHTLHDMNAALFRFLRRHPDLPGPLQRLALGRAAGRATRWAKRHGSWRSYRDVMVAPIAATLGLLTADAATEAWLCEPFRLTNSIWIPSA